MSKLNIIFILGSLEEHKCGVSDYVRRVCAYLGKKEHSCTCIAINDKHICTENRIRTIPTGTENIELLRLSSKITWWKRIQITKKTIEALNPNVVSIQFVPYAFNSKGLALPIIALILMTNRELKWHIMFHELWVLQNKINSVTSLIKRIIGEAQKTIILAITYICRPNIVHVSNYSYQLRLASYGICSEILPIFSNIPFVPIKKTVSKKDNSWKFIIFGRITEFWNPYELLANIEKARIKYGIDHCKFVSIGKTGERGKRIWHDMNIRAKTLYPAFTFHYKGEISQEEVSLHLQTSDFGLSTTPSALLQKSGSVAAMLSHGLPVIVSRISDQHHALNKSLLERGRFILLDKDFQENLVSINKMDIPTDSFYEIVEKFKSDLYHALN